MEKCPKMGSLVLWMDIHYANDLRKALRMAQKGCFWNWSENGQGFGTLISYVEELL